MLKEQKNQIQGNVKTTANHTIENTHQVECVRTLLTSQDESLLRESAQHLANYWTGNTHIDFELKEEVLKLLPRINTQIQKELWASLLKKVHFSMKEKFFIVELLCFWLCSSLSKDIVKINCMYTLAELINKNDFSRQTALSSIRNQIVWGSIKVRTVGEEILAKM